MLKLTMRVIVNGATVDEITFKTGVDANSTAIHELPRAAVAAINATLSPIVLVEYEFVETDQGYTS